jgi:hypothetical protein
MNYEYKFKEITGFEAYEDNNLRPKVPSDYYVEWLEEQLTIHGVVVSLPRFKKGQTLKRISKYTDDFVAITIESIEDTKAGFRYTSKNGVCFYENELLAY